MNNSGNSGCGTVFQISASGSGYSTLHEFQGTPDGDGPRSGLIAAQGTLYGTTSDGGCCGGRCLLGSGCRTVFSISTSGTETVLHSFRGYYFGAWPAASLTSVSGRLYGVTYFGGHGCCGEPGAVHYGDATVFALSP